MPSLPREKCPACEQAVPVRANGAFREHNRGSRLLREKCPASGKQLEEAREIARAEVAKEQGAEAVAEAEAVLEKAARPRPHRGGPKG